MSTMATPRVLVILSACLAILCVFPLCALADRPEPSGAHQSTGARTREYCPSQGGSTEYESIQDVTWHVEPGSSNIYFVVEIYIANPSDCQPGEACPEYDNSPEYVNGWVDWNGDQVWDPCERVFDLALTGYAAINYEGTMTGYAQAEIPPEHVDEPLMRVNLGWGYDPNDPCDPVWTWGDVGDYSMLFERYAVTKLTVGSDGHEIYEVGDRVIWEQELGPWPGCGLTNIKTDYHWYPFAGSMGSTVTLYARIEYCGSHGAAPAVECSWSISPLWPATIFGSASGTGWLLPIPITMPSHIDSTGVSLRFTMRSPFGAASEQSIRRKLFVTYDAPLAGFWGGPPPRRDWYDKACGWAEDYSTDVYAVRLVRVLGWFYGRDHWRYGYDLGSGRLCSWKELVGDALCNYGDCYTFSEVLENLCAVLGIGGFIWDRQTGSHGKGFMTEAGYLSIDDVFLGNAWPGPSGSCASCDRFRFSSHSLRRRGSVYHDATFGREYTDPTAFIEWNITGESGGVYSTAEGATFIRHTGDCYDSWGNYEYYPPPLLLARLGGQESSDPLPALSVAAGDRPGNLEFTEAVDYSLVDEDIDGYADALAADVEFTVHTEGEYLVSGHLTKEGATVSVCPRYRSQLAADYDYEGPPGTFVARLEFSGEDIFQHGGDGPYQLHVTGLSAAGLEDTLTTHTPPYNHTDFGELDAHLASATDVGLDLDQDGTFDVLRVAAEVDVRSEGTFAVSGTVFEDTTGVTTSSTSVALQEGMSVVELDFSGEEIRKHAADGPYEVAISLNDTTGVHLPSLSHVTAPYEWSEFEVSLLTPTGEYRDWGVDQDDNGIYDLLAFEFDVVAETGGMVTVTAWLGEMGGPDEQQTLSFATARRVIRLVPGPQTLRLNFDGTDIRRRNVDGPYRVLFVEVTDENLAVVDYLKLGYSTDPYTAAQFEEGAPDIAFLDSFTDAAVDTSQSGLADVLVVSLAVESSYDAVLLGSADLHDSEGRYIANGTGLVEVSAETPGELDLYFDGRYIFGNLRDGPYTVRNTYIYPSVDVTEGVRIGIVGDTGPYSFEQFEPAAVVTGVVEEAPGVLAVGAEVRSPYSVDWTDESGSYRLIYLESDSTTIRASFEGIPFWDIYWNGEYVGQGDSIRVHVSVGEVDTLEFLVSPGDVPVAPEKESGRTIFQISPNPFSDGIEISFALAQEGPVSLRIYDVRGRLVRTLIDAESRHGANTIRWDGRDDRGIEVESGIYCYELASPAGRCRGLMTLLR